MRLPFHTKLSYGIGGVADNAMYTLAGTFLLFFLTSVAGIQPAVAGVIVALGSVWEVICGPIVGYLSDHTEGRFGRRKPFLLMAVIPVTVTVSLLFTTIHAGMAVKIIYYLAMTLLFWQSFATFFVPYMAWGSELTEDYDERTVLRSYAYLFNQLGMALGMVIPAAMVDLLVNMGRSTEFSWAMTGVLIGSVSAAALLICALTIHETDDPDFVRKPGEKHKLDLSFLKNILLDYRDILKVRPVRSIVGASLVFLIANTFFSADRIYYYTYNLGLSAARISTLMLVITVAGIALAPAIARISGMTDKKQMFILGLVFSGIILTAARFLCPDNFGASIFICLVYAVGSTCYWQLMPSMIYDVCEAEELYSGKKRAGQVISLQALSESLSTAVGSQLLGVILQLARFSEGAVQPGSALHWISNCYTLIPGICMLLVALIALRHPVNKDSFRRIQAALARRAAGETVDMEDFRDIYGRP